MRRLFITADELGITSQRTHSIFQLTEHGTVTGTSIIPNFPHSDIAARHAKERDLSAGLHINLTDGFPLSEERDISSLLQTDGVFLGMEGLERGIAESEIDRTHIERELRSQFEWMLDTYGQPTHVSGYHHIHVHPFVSKILVPLLDRYSISFVRIPSEPVPPFGYEIGEEQIDSIDGLNARANQARALFAAHGIRSTDHFRGLCLQGNASQRNLRHTLARLPEGTTELMVHPGSMNPSGDSFESDPQRQTEMQMLLSDSLRVDLAERKIELGTWGELY